jgi:catechol 2,3-dioxygenase-like lactoylglutathione lyase family enzyme
VILYVTLGFSDFARTERFYTAVCATVGMARMPQVDDGWLGFGPAYGEGTGLYLCPPFDGAAPTAGNGTMVAFEAPDAATVRAFHAAALAHGGTDEGAPGVRPYYEPGFYPAYVRDPGGNKLACVCWTYTARDDRDT